MIKSFLSDASHIYLACGATDFRKQSDSLCAIVTNNFNLNPFDGDQVFMFCNKRRTSIKVLRYDKNGFILAQKKLIDIDKMKFQWPKNQEDIKSITIEQVKWLLQGLTIEPKKAFKEHNLSEEKIAF